MSRPPRTSKLMSSVERYVRAVVDDLGRGRHEEQRQEHAGQQQDDEAVQRDLAEHEGPVVRKDLREVLLQELVGRDALVQERRRSAPDLLDGTHPRSQKLGPTGSANPCCATK